MTGRAAVAAPMGSPVAVAVALPRPGRPAAVAALLLAVVLLTVFLLVRYAVLRRGGWRRSWRGLRSEAALTGQAFTEPLRALGRYRQGLRALTAHLADPGTHALAHRALDAAASVLASAPGAYPYAVGVGSGTVTVEVAGRRLPSPPAPWRVDGTTPGRWRIDRGELRRPGGLGRRVLVAVGVRGEECVLLDLAASPGTVAVEGDTAAGRGLLQAVAAQLDGPAGVAGTVVARGVHPQYRGPDLESVLGSLERSGTSPDGAPAVVVCAAPRPEQAARLGALAEADTALCLVHGEVAGPRWTLRVDHRNRLTAAELDLRSDCAPLGRAVARALRGARRGHPGEPLVPSERPTPAAQPDDAPWTPNPVPAEPAHQYGHAPAPPDHPTARWADPEPPRPRPAQSTDPYARDHGSYDPGPGAYTARPAPQAGTPPYARGHDTGSDGYPAPTGPDAPHGPAPYARDHETPDGYSTPPRADAQAGPAPYPQGHGDYETGAGGSPTSIGANAQTDPGPYAPGHGSYDTGPSGYPSRADAPDGPGLYARNHGTGSGGHPTPTGAGAGPYTPGHGAHGTGPGGHPAPPQADAPGNHGPVPDGHPPPTAPWADAPARHAAEPYGAPPPAEPAPSERARRAARTRHYVRRDGED